MKKFDYDYFEKIDDIEKFANNNDVTIVSVLPNESVICPFIACYYKN